MMMRAVAALLLLSVWAIADQLSALRQATLAGNHGVVRLYPSNYSEFTVKKSPDYTMLVLFTVTDPQYGCGACPTTISEYIKASRSYGAAKGIRFNYTGIPPALQSPVTSDTRDVFFGVVDFKYNREAFEMHGIGTVPHVIVFEKGKPPLSTGKEKKLPIPPEQFVENKGNYIFADDMLRRIPGERIEVLVSASERQPIVYLAIIIIAIAGGLSSLSASGAPIYKQAWFWGVACVLAYAVSISGAIGCVIKTPPLVGYQNNKIEVFRQDGQEQYTLEGMIMGCLNLMAAGCVIGLIMVGKSKTLSIPVRLLLTILLITTFSVVGMHILAQYQYKTRWYTPDAVMDKDLRRAFNSYYIPAKKWYVKNVVPRALAAFNQTVSYVSNATTTLWKSEP